MAKYQLSRHEMVEMHVSMTKVFNLNLDTNQILAIWTQLGLAYLVHKSLIFFRVPLTAAVLPKVVKTLRKWGYNIGKKKPQRD